MSGRLRGYMAFDMKFTDKFNPMQWISHSNSIVSQVCVLFLSRFQFSLHYMSLNIVIIIFTYVLPSHCR